MSSRSRVRRASYPWHHTILFNDSPNEDRQLYYLLKSDQTQFTAQQRILLRVQLQRKMEEISHHLRERSVEPS